MNDPNDAADALAALDASPALQSADEIANAFEVAGARIARSLESAAQSGELSFSAMAESILNDVARLAITELVEGPLTALVNGMSGGNASGATTVNLNISGATDPAGFRRSEGQISASLARAVSAGQRRI